MKKPPFRVNDAPRFVQPESGQPIGWLQSIKKQIERLRMEVEGVELRLEKRLGKGEPAAIVAKKTFLPDTSYTFDFDYLQNGSSSVTSQYVLKDGITYEIPVVMPPPGVMLMRSMKVKLYQRLFVPNVGPMQVPMYYGDYFLGDPQFSDLDWYQTRKFAFPDSRVFPPARIFMRRCSFLWNLIDTKSGAQFSDELMSDQIFVPQGSYSEPLTASPVSSALPTGLGFVQNPGRIEGNTGRYLEFDVPWLFERDAQLTFFFRPIMPVIQPTANSGYFPYPWNDLEQNGTVRNSAVTVQIELHGTRYVDEQDARREGAKVD